MKPFFAEEYEDSAEAIAYLAQRVRANDVLYIHAAMREQFKLYGGMLPVATNSVLYGKVGMPCCPRKNYRSPQQESAADVIGEISALERCGSGAIPMAPSYRSSSSLGSIYSVTILRYLNALSQSKVAKKPRKAKFTGVYIGHFRCKPK